MMQQKVYLNTYVNKRGTVFYSYLWLAPTVFSCYMMAFSINNLRSLYCQLSIIIDSILTLTLISHELYVQQQLKPAHHEKTSFLKKKMIFLKPKVTVYFVSGNNLLLNCTENFHWHVHEFYRISDTVICASAIFLIQIRCHWGYF